MSTKAVRVAASIGVAAVCAVGLAATPAGAAARGSQVVLDNDVVAPFQIAINHDQTYVTDGFAGTVIRLGKDGPTVLAQAPGAAGVALTPNGKTIAYAWSNDSHTEAGLTAHTSGRPDVVADLAGYEAAQNPDGINNYGIVAGGNMCAEEILGGLTGGPASYDGIVDSHPYAVARDGDRWVVADAGANAILGVADDGTVSTVAVLPPQPVTLTSEMVAGLEQSAQVDPGAFSCLVGVTYAFEPVPTDVEVDQHGNLWVSVLPGGPEGPELGARGAVYEIAARTGKVTRVADGFLGATNLAVAPDGSVYVAELFGGQVDVVRDGVTRPFLAVGQPLSLAVHGGYLYVGTMAQLDPETSDVISPGSVIRVKR